MSCEGNIGTVVEKDYYGLPSGNQYTKETILRKRSDLYEELSKFYEENIVNSIRVGKSIPSARVGLRTF